MSKPETVKKYTVKLTEQDVVTLLEMVNFIGAQKKSKQVLIIEKKLYKALGV